MHGRFIGRMVLLVLLQLACATTLYAQATRTWVSGVGDDANPCSRTAPCKTWAGAISKTAPGGEIDALDPGGFGALTITKSISIVGKGGTTSVLVAGTNGIVVAAGATDVVMIRDIELDGLLGGGNANAGLNGIRFISGASLNVEGCKIFGFSQQGIDINPSSGNSKVTIVRTSLYNNAGGGIYVHPSGGTVNVAVSDSVMQFNTRGLRADDNSTVAAQNNVATNNTNGGFVAVSNGATVNMNIEGGSASLNGTGVFSQGAAATVRISNMSISGNTTGISGAGSNILSFGNNRVAGNTTNGAPTGPVPGGQL